MLLIKARRSLCLDSASSTAPIPVSPVYYGMGELTESMSPLPQIAVDRRSEFMNALSRVIKKVPTIRDILVHGIK